MKVIESWTVSRYTVLTFDRPVFSADTGAPANFTKIMIDGIAYRPEMLYDAPNSIAIIGNVEAAGKDVQFC